MAFTVNNPFNTILTDPEATQAYLTSPHQYTPILADYAKAANDFLRTHIQFPKTDEYSNHRLLLPHWDQFEPESFSQEIDSSLFPINTIDPLTIINDTYRGENSRGRDLRRKSRVSSMMFGTSSIDLSPQQLLLIDTLLSIACHNNYIEIIQFFINDNSLCIGKTALQHAIISCHIELVKIIFQFCNPFHSISINKQCNTTSYGSNSINYNGFDRQSAVGTLPSYPNVSPFFKILPHKFLKQCLSTNNAQIITWALSLKETSHIINGVRVRIVDQEEISEHHGGEPKVFIPLEWAVRSLQPTAAVLLLSHGADPSSMHEFGKSINQLDTELEEIQSEWIKAIVESNHVETLKFWFNLLKISPTNAPFLTPNYGKTKYPAWKLAIHKAKHISYEYIVGEYEKTIKINTDSSTPNNNSLTNQLFPGPICPCPGNNTHNGYHSCPQQEAFETFMNRRNEFWEDAPHLIPLLNSLCIKTPQLSTFLDKSRSHLGYTPLQHAMLRRNALVCSQLINFGASLGYNCGVGIYNRTLGSHTFNFNLVVQNDIEIIEDQYRFYLDTKNTDQNQCTTTSSNQYTALLEGISQRKPVDHHLHPDTAFYSLLLNSPQIIGWANMYDIFHSSPANQYNNVIDDDDEEEEEEEEPIQNWETDIYENDDWNNSSAKSPSTKTTFGLGSKGISSKSPIPPPTKSKWITPSLLLASLPTSSPWSEQTLPKSLSNLSPTLPPPPFKYFNPQPFPHTRPPISPLELLVSHPQVDLRARIKPHPRDGLVSQLEFPQHYNITMMAVHNDLSDNLYNICLGLINRILLLDSLDTKHQTLQSALTKKSDDGDTSSDIHMLPLLFTDRFQPHFMTSTAPNTFSIDHDLITSLPISQPESPPLSTDIPITPSYQPPPIVKLLKSAKTFRRGSIDMPNNSQNDHRVDHIIHQHRITNRLTMETFRYSELKYCGTGESASLDDDGGNTMDTDTSDSSSDDDSDTDSLPNNTSKGKGHQTQTSTITQNNQKILGTIIILMIVAMLIVLIGVIVKQIRGNSVRVIVE